MDDLIPITQEALDKTPLRQLSLWVIYRLCREGALPHVQVGRRRYLTADGIAAFIARGGELGRGMTQRTKLTEAHQAAAEEATAAERVRVAEIRRIAAKAGLGDLAEDWARRMIELGVSVDKARGVAAAAR